jgi:hypothetical protein
MCSFHRSTRSLNTLVAVLVMICCQLAQADGTDCATDGADNAARLPAESPSGASCAQTLGKWIDALAVAESGDRPWIVHRDRDGRDYYGCLQFRETTFRFFMKKFNLTPDAEPAEVMNLMFDCAFQKRLAERMIRENRENWKHWRKSVERIGLPPGASGKLDSRAGQSEHQLK